MPKPIVLLTWTLRYRPLIFTISWTLLYKFKKKKKKKKKKKTNKDLKIYLRRRKSISRYFWENSMSSREN